MIRIVILAIVVVSASARADDASEATRLFEEGRALLEQKNYTEACAKFARSSALDRKPGTQLNLGDCAERGGQLRRAWLLFDDAAREYERIQKSADARLVDNPTSPDAARDSQVAAAGSRFARQRADALSPRLAKVIVRLTGVRPEGLTVRIGDRAVPPATEIVELLDPGVIPVTVTAPGHEPFTSAPRVESGKQAVVEVPELRVPGKPDDRIGAPEAGRQRSRVRIAIALAAGSALAFAVTTAVGLSARSQYNRAEQLCTRDAQQELSCPPGAADDIDSAGTKADFATVTGIAGGLLAAGAFVVYFTAPRESVQIAPIASPNSAGISIFGRF